MIISKNKNQEKTKMTKGNKIIKNDIIRKITAETDLKHKETTEVVQKFFDYIADNIVNGENIEFRGFGVFELRVAKEKIGRNPNKPKDEVIIPEHVVVKFKPGCKLKKRVLQLKTKNFK